MLYHTETMMCVDAVERENKKLPALQQWLVAVDGELAYDMCDQCIILHAGNKFFMAKFTSAFACCWIRRTDLFA